MGVDIQTYRARIGSHKNSLCGEAIENYRHSRGCDVAALVAIIIVSNGMKTVGCVLFIGILLMIAGVEPNPGPMEKDTAPKLYHAGSTRIKITGLMENMNKQMLEMFFEKEERDGGGKVKDIDIDTENKSAIVEFEGVTGVDFIMKKTPMTIFGMQVHIEVTGNDTEEPKMIKISKLPANINKEMLLMFFENKIECDGKVVDVTVNTYDSFAIVEFDKSAAVYGVMENRPFTIFGFEVEVDTFGSGTLTEEPKMIKLTKLSVDMNRVMLKRFFEHAIECGGKVMEITVNSKEQSAIVTFDTSAALYEIMNKRPLTILGFKIDVDVYTGKDDSQTKHAGRGFQGADSLQTRGDKVDSKTEHAGRGMRGEKSVQTTESITVSSAKTGHTECDEKEPDSSKINEAISVTREEIGLTKGHKKEPDSSHENKSITVSSAKTGHTECDEKEPDSSKINEAISVTREEICLTKGHKKEPDSSHENKTNTVARKETGPKECNENEPDSLQGKSR